MFSRLRRVANKIVAVIAPIGKYIQSAGSSLFSSTTAMLYFTHKDLTQNEDSALKDPAVILVSSAAILANMLVTSRTRVPAMRRQIAGQMRKALRLTNESKEEKTASPVLHTSCHATCGCVVAKTTSYTAKFFTRSAATWSTVNTVFFNLKLMEFLYIVLFSHLLALLNSDKENPFYETVVWATSLAIAGSNLLSYISLNMEKADQSADVLAEKLGKGDFKFDKYSAMTLFIVALNTIPTFMFSNVTTEKSLRKLPFFHDMSSSSIAIPVGVSTASAIVTGILSSNRQIYNKFTNKNSTPVIRTLDPVNLANIYESIWYGAANMVSMLIKMRERDHSLDIYSAQAYLPAAFFGALSGWVGYLFSRQSYMDTLLFEEFERNNNIVRSVGLNEFLLRTEIYSIDIIAPEIIIELQPVVTIEEEKITEKRGFKKYNPMTFKSGDVAELAEPFLSDDRVNSLSLV